MRTSRWTVEMVADFVHEPAEIDRRHGNTDRQPLLLKMRQSVDQALARAVSACSLIGAKKGTPAHQASFPAEPVH